MRGRVFEGRARRTHAFVIAALTAGALVAWGCHGTLTERAAGDAATGTDGEVEADAGTPVTIGDDAKAPADAAVPFCAIVLAENYDQSCALDTDCVSVGEVTTCPVQACVGCMTASVNQDAAAGYNAAFNASLAQAPFNPVCGCPCIGRPICRNGKCQAGYCQPARADTLPACSDAGGLCAYAATTSCTQGPPDACAYSDEVCCL